jgi:uncharacterized FAD-dependent dehydrogenase
MKRYRLNNLVSAYDDPRSPAERLAAALGLPVAELQQVEVLRRSLDARKKPRLKDVLALAFSVNPALLGKGIAGLEEWQPAERPALPEHRLAARPIVVGAGPAGQFAALGLARQGLKPIVIERGADLAERRRHVKDLWLKRQLHPDSNVQFGEGGAGTFSDGKLTSRGSSWFTQEVLKTFVSHGASEEILASHLPHIGTEGIRRVSRNLRAHLEELGTEFRFNTRLDSLVDLGGRVRIRLSSGDSLETDALLLAIGHSARDTASMLMAAGVAMDLKPFAMGLRVEHPRGFIDEAQYGASCRFDITGAATYKLTAKADRKGRSIYSFCMCPGGMVVLAASEEDRLVVNGMSWASRRMAWSNAALVIQVGAEDLKRWGADWRLKSDALLGHHIQQELESRAFILGGSNWSAPAQRPADFLKRRATKGVLPASSYRPDLASAQMDSLLPDPLADGLREGLKAFERSMPGFVEEGLLIAPETRTSAPLRILRDPESRRSPSHPWLFPLGEGAGYAGGIVSSAADGLRTGMGFIATSSQ